MILSFMIKLLTVSTHSRLKAAGKSYVGIVDTAASFNTQPPEGGWSATDKASAAFKKLFQHTAA